ncbi:MAG: phosphoenolpyruvate carboxylase, partial [Planctomycetota bacterium]
MPQTDTVILDRAASKVDVDANFLITCLAEVLESCGDSDLIPYLPWRGQEPKAVDSLPVGRGEALLQVLSFCFQLLNAVEENVAMQARRWREDGQGLSAERGTWAMKLRRALAQGLDEGQLREAISTCRVEPVLTAHPTEAKRAAVLQLHRELYVLLFEREYGLWSRSELQDQREAIKGVIERLWRSGELQHEKPTVR